MAHHAAWEGAEQGEEAVEEAATTIFQKIVRSELHWDQSSPSSIGRKFPEKLRRRSSAYFEPERRESVKSIRCRLKDDWKIIR